MAKKEKNKEDDLPITLAEEKDDLDDVVDIIEPPSGCQYLQVIRLEAPDGDESKTGYIGKFIPPLEIEKLRKKFGAGYYQINAVGTRKGKKGRYVGTWKIRVAGTDEDEIDKDFEDEPLNKETIRDLIKDELTTSLTPKKMEGEQADDWFKKALLQVAMVKATSSDDWVKGFSMMTKMQDGGIERLVKEMELLQGIKGEPGGGSGDYLSVIVNGLAQVLTPILASKLKIPDLTEIPTKTPLPITEKLPPDATKIEKEQTEKKENVTQTTLPKGDEVNLLELLNRNPLAELGNLILESLEKKEDPKQVALQIGFVCPTDKLEIFKKMDPQTVISLLSKFFADEETQKLLSDEKTPPYIDQVLEKLRS